MTTQVSQQIFYRGFKTSHNAVLFFFWGGGGIGLFFSCRFVVRLLPGTQFQTPAHSPVPKFTFSSAFARNPKLSNNELLMRAGNPELGQEAASAALPPIKPASCPRRSDSSRRTSPASRSHSRCPAAFPRGTHCPQRFPLKSVGNSFHRV